MKKSWTRAAASMLILMLMLTGCGTEGTEPALETEPQTGETSDGAFSFTEETYPKVGYTAYTEAMDRAIRSAYGLGADTRGAMERTAAFEALRKGSLDAVIDIELAADPEDEFSATKIAEEPVAFFVSPEIGLTNVTLEDLAGIFRGEITDWSSFGLPEGEIRLVLPDSEPLRRSLKRFFGTSDESEKASELPDVREGGWIACTYASVFKNVYQAAGNLLTVLGASPIENPKAYPLRTGYALYLKKDASEELVRFALEAEKAEIQSRIGEAGVIPVIGEVHPLPKPADPEGPSYGIKLTDAYHLNSILFFKKFAETDGVRFAFPQIDGLKSDDVEKTVNVLMFSDVMDAVETMVPEVKEGTELQTESQLVSAYQNTLSVRTIVSIVRSSEHEAEREVLQAKTIRTNFELVHGTRLKFADLFNPSTVPETLLDMPSILKLRTSETDSDPEFSLSKRVSELIAGAENTFEFDEQSVRIYDETGSAEPFEIRFERHLDETAIYGRYWTDESIYDGVYEKDAVLPVLVRRDSARAEVVRKDENSFVDATFYCNENSDTVRLISSDVMDRLREKAAALRSAKDDPFLCNAVLTLYEMKNAVFQGVRSPYYVSVQTYTYNCPDNASFEEVYLRTVELLRKPESLEIRENLFLPYMADHAMLPEKPAYEFVTWYYDAEGHFLGEK